MMQKIRNWTAALLLAVVGGGGLVATALPQTVSAQSCPDRVLTVPTWYRGLTDADCNIESPSDGEGGLSRFVWTIALNIVEMIMQVVGFASIGFLIFGGFKYMTAMGEPANIVKAKDTIRNAIFGLLIAIFSVAIVNFAAGAISG